METTRALKFGKVAKLSVMTDFHTVLTLNFGFELHELMTLLGDEVFNSLLEVRSGEDSG